MVILRGSKKVSIILPTLNEKDNIILLIDAIESTLKERPIEIIVVDDNSPDGTWQVVKERSQNDPRVFLIHRINRTGLTSALLEGIEQSTGEIIVWMDVDFSMPPEKIPELVAEVERGTDIAVGSRFVKGGQDNRGSQYRFQMFLSRFISWLTSLLLSPKFRDYTSGFIAVRREVVKELGLRGDYGEYFIDFMYRAIVKGYTFKEIPYICIPRVYGESKTATTISGYFKRGWKYLWTILRVRLNPKTQIDRKITLQ